MFRARASRSRWLSSLLSCFDLTRTIVCFSHADYYVLMYLDHRLMLYSVAIRNKYTDSSAALLNPRCVISARAQSERRASLIDSFDSVIQRSSLSAQRPLLRQVPVGGGLH